MDRVRASCRATPIDIVSANSSRPSRTWSRLVPSLTAIARLLGPSWAVPQAGTSCTTRLLDAPVSLRGRAARLRCPSGQLSFSPNWSECSSGTRHGRSLRVHAVARSLWRRVLWPVRGFSSDPQRLASTFQSRLLFLSASVARWSTWSLCLTILLAFGLPESISKSLPNKEKARIKKLCKG